MFKPIPMPAPVHVHIHMHVNARIHTRIYTRMQVHAHVKCTCIRVHDITTTLDMFAPRYTTHTYMHIIVRARCTKALVDGDQRHSSVAPLRTHARRPAPPGAASANLIWQKKTVYQRYQQKRK